MKWINVKDKLPELFQDVLCFAKSKDGKFNSVVECNYMPRVMPHEPKNLNPFCVKIFCEGYLYLSLEKGKIQNPAINESHFYFGEVTHWMPLTYPDEE